MLLVVNDSTTVDLNLLPWDDITSILFVSVSSKLCMWRKPLMQMCKSKFIEFNQVFIIPPIKDGEPVPEQLLLGCGLIYDTEVEIYGCH